MFRGKFRALNVFIRREGTVLSNDQISYCKKQGVCGKGVENKDKANRRKETIDQKLLELKTEKPGRESTNQSSYFEKSNQLIKH